MTNEERDRAIDSLIEQNAHHEAPLERDEQHIRELQQSFDPPAAAGSTPTGLALCSERATRYAGRAHRRARRSVQIIADIAARQDERIRALEGES